MTARFSFTLFRLNPTTWPRSLIREGPLMFVEASSRGSRPLMLFTIEPALAARLASARGSTPVGEVESLHAAAPTAALASVASRIDFQRTFWLIPVSPSRLGNRHTESPARTRQLGRKA